MNGSKNKKKLFGRISINMHIQYYAQVIDKSDTLKIMSVLVPVGRKEKKFEIRFSEELLTSVPSSPGSPLEKSYNGGDP